MQETAFVHPPDAPKKGNSVWTLEPPDAMGGAGLFATANDYSRLLGAILSDESPILRKESIDELFKPQFPPHSGSFNALNAYLVEGEKDTHVWRAYPPTASSDVSQHKIQINHGLGGVIVLNDVPGRRKEESLCWSGLPNLHWWADRETGVAGLMFTQAQPMKSELITNMFLELEAAIYEKIG